MTHPCKLASALALAALPGSAFAQDAHTITLQLDRAMLINIAIAAIIAIGLAVCIIALVRMSRAKRAKAKRAATVATSLQAPAAADPGQPSIVVRRRTTSILKKQSLDDVVDNPSYLVIETADFMNNSAVNRIYIKDECVKDIYNLYAEDLRNAEKPKEDGCMVLGRWVFDPQTRTYDISLESVVYPGDDAVFKEYELNFGGKIKMRIAEKLRKLRRDTNLQYDLTCWVHSHPGLGVFFSNSDNNVQMQLRNPQHPNFLIGIVVDILTQQQEMGIFTFLQDGQVATKHDITRAYSLEELYRWAIESAKAKYQPDDHLNLLANAQAIAPWCAAIELNNHAAVDLSQIGLEAEPGIAGWVIGYDIDAEGANKYVLTRIDHDMPRSSTGVVGCVAVMPSFDFDELAAAIDGLGDTISFAIAIDQGASLAVAVPVMEGELLADDRYFGTANIDDIKTWTRRKR